MYRKLLASRLRVIQVPKDDRVSLLFNWFFLINYKVEVTLLHVIPVTLSGVSRSSLLLHDGGSYEEGMGLATLEAPSCQS